MQAEFTWLSTALTKSRATPCRFSPLTTGSGVRANSAPEAIELFKSRWEQNGGIPVAAHDIYLINLAARDELILSRSIAAFAEELVRCAGLGIQYLIMHPGAHLGEGTEAGLIRFVENLDRAIESSGVESVCVLIENTAGQGSSLGSSFEEINFILRNSRFGKTMGVCYDTSHGFAAGYDMRDEKAYGLTISRFDRGNRNRPAQVLSPE